MKIKSLYILPALLLGIVLSFYGCNKVADDSTSAVKLVITKITGTNWTGNESSVLESDVLVVDPDTGATTIQNDYGTAYMMAYLYNPNETEPSFYENVQIKEYHVSYVRSDNRNREGVDVPRSFWGRLSVMIPPDGNEHGVVFILVRADAKTEKPLVDLRYGDSEKELEVTAVVEFYGEDLSGHSVYVKGSIPVVFANYANEKK